MDNSDLVSIAPQDRDLAIRTMIGEEPTPQGQSAVASVILNRAQSGEYGGSSLSKVVLAPGEFEPWKTGAKSLMAISPDDPRYKHAAAIFDGVASGDIPDLTGGSTHFYAPKAQAALGRNAPSWAQGEGLSIGQSMFYAPDGKVSYRPPMASKTAQIVDPFSEYETTPPKAGAAVASPTAAAPAQSSAADDPFSEYETTKVHAGPYRRPDGAMYWNPPPGQYEKDYPQAAKGDVAPADAAPASPIGANDTVRAMATGVPIIGGLLNKMDAATNATLAPIGNAFFAPDQQLKGDTWGERYQNALQQQQDMDTSFATEHPVANTVDQLAGGLAAGIVAGRAAPELFGMGNASRATKFIMGGLSGGLINGTDAAIRSGGDPNAIKNGAGIGTVLGVGGVGAGEAISAGVNALSNTLSRVSPAARNIVDILTKAGLTPEQAQARLAQIGAHATMADLDPSITAEAGGIASMGGEPTSILKKAYGARAADANNRMAAAVDQHLGTRPDLTATEAAIKEQASKEASPYYEAAKSTAGQMDTAPILANIESKMKSAVGGVKNILQTAKNYLTYETAGMVGPDGKATTMIVPKDDPQSILGVRQALDDIIEKAPQSGDATTAGRNAVRAAQDVRGQIDDLLKTDPNIRAGDAAYSKQMKNLEALQEGTDVFKAGTRIEDVNRSIATKTPDQVAAMQHGALSAVHDAMDNARQGDFAAARSLFAKSSANRAKLDAMFPNAGKVFDTLDNEMAMRATEQKVAQGSDTAQRLAIQQKYNPQGNISPGSIVAPIVGEAVGGAPGAAAGSAINHAWNAARNALTSASRARLISGTAERLSAMGNMQKQFMQEISRAARVNGPANALAEIASRGANLAVRSPVDVARNALWNSGFLPQGVGGSPN